MKAKALTSVAVTAVVALNSCGVQTASQGNEKPTPSYAILDECPYPSAGGIATLLHDPMMVASEGSISLIGEETKQSNSYGEYLGREIALDGRSLTPDVLAADVPPNVVLTERLSEPAGAATSIDSSSLYPGQTVVLLSHADGSAVPIVMAVALSDQAGNLTFPGRCDRQFQQEIAHVLSNVAATQGLSEREALLSWIGLVSAGRDDTQFVEATSGTMNDGPSWEDQPTDSRSLAPDAVPESIRADVDVRAIFFELDGGIEKKTVSVTTKSGVSAASMILDGSAPSQAFFLSGSDVAFQVHLANASGRPESDNVLVELPIGDLKSAAGYLVTGSLDAGTLSYTALSLDAVATRLGMTVDQVLAARTQALTVAGNGG